MRTSSPGLRRSLLAAAALLGLSGAASAQMELKILAPAAPGGGWDQTARSMQQALVQSGAAKSVQVTNIPGAGGTIGLAQFVNSAKGDGNQLMVNGFVMVGAILTNKAPVTLDQVTPIARLTGEYARHRRAGELAASRPRKDLADALKADPGKVDLGRRLGRRRRPHRGRRCSPRRSGADPTKINYIPFSGGGEAIAAIMGGKVTAGVSGYGEFEGQIKAGKLRVLARHLAEAHRGRRRPDAEGAGRRRRASPTGAR